MATSRPVAKTLIKYNNNNSEVNDEEENELIDVEFNKKKRSSWNDENAIDFKWSDVQEKH